MPSLIHLNGPPGIGKSTLAQMYVDDHPGVLNLDIDHVLWLIGGWQDNVGESLTMARSIGLSMATTHLRSGHDVVLPQFTGRLNEIERFEAVAQESDALFCEIMLMDTKERSVERFSRRSDAGRPLGIGRSRRSSAATAATPCSPTSTTSCVRSSTRDRVAVSCAVRPARL
jgi:predicted kinase